MEVVLWISGIVAALFVVDRLGVWAESRGWIYWRKGRGRAAAGSVFASMAEVFQPSQVHYVQEFKHERRVAAADGQPFEDSADPVDD